MQTKSKAHNSNCSHNWNETETVLKLLWNSVIHFHFYCADSFIPANNRNESFLVNSFIFDLVVLAPKRSQTSCNRFRTLQCVWSQEPRNTSVVFHGNCAMICTGWRFHSGCSNCLPWLFIGVLGTALQGTSPTAACQSPKFPAVNISVRPAVASWTFHGFVAAHLRAFSVVGPMVWNSLLDSLRDSSDFVRRVWTL